jgi:hypothetical protein
MRDPVVTGGGGVMNTRMVVVTLCFGSFVANMNTFALEPFLALIADDIDRTA